tara:strand:- start:66 stop:2558 length:2493 start_codon:yes stop_codon:yes gene_type:complete
MGSKDMTKNKPTVVQTKTDTTAPDPVENLNVIKLENDDAYPIDYNVKELESFMDLVFCKHLPDDNGHTLVWATSTGAPGFPREEDELFSKLKRMKRPQALYYGTSTCVLDEKTGSLFNRKSLFKRLHVVVLDDIGTKVKLESLPKELEPTYIVESSAGNFQYGYVLETPIDVLEHAQALIQLVYESGYSDAGGMMPTKLVRLPGGINGKIGPKKHFKVKLTKMDGPLWTPQDLLRVMDIEVSWAEVLKDTEGMVKRRASRSVGTSPWSPIKAQAAALGGIVDPVLEWLYDNKMVMSETDEWVQIECPWKHDHTDGSDDAGYSPLGRGHEHEERRGFNCFHGHCKNRKIGDLLQYVAANGGPEAPVFDPAAKLVANWAYDSASDAVWQIQGVGQPRSITMNAFKNTFPRKVQVHTADGKVKNIAETALWLTSPGRVVVQGQTFNPTDTAKIVANKEDLLINMFFQPEWGEGTYDQKDIDMFEQFMEYLLPTDKERKYFLNWLAAKCQNLGFRGAAILMIAKQQGTGRTTLSDMIETMIGSENVENVPFARLTGDGAFNEWMEKPLVVTNETKDTSDKKSYYKIYEGLKEYIDPRPKRERINPKYGQQRISMVHSSYLMFSNHDNALAVAGNDRRFYVMRNAVVPALPAYFTRLNEWLQIQDSHGKPKWARSVWRWLREREVVIEDLLAPAPSTAAKQAMINATKTPLQVAIETIVACSPGDFVATYKIKMILNDNAVRLALHDVPSLEAQIRAIVGNLTETAGGGDLVKVEKRNIVPKIKLTALGFDGNERKYVNHHLSPKDKAKIREDLLAWDSAEITAKINDALDILES